MAFLQHKNAVTSLYELVLVIKGMRMIARSCFSARKADRMMRQVKVVVALLLSVLFVLADRGQSFAIVGSPSTASGSSIIYESHQRGLTTRLYSIRGDVSLPATRNETTITAVEPSQTALYTALLPIGDYVDVGDTPAVPVPAESLAERVLSTYLGPRLVLGVLAAVYATNFPAGALMNDHLPASAATCSRMLVAALALSPAVKDLRPELRIPAVLCGFFTASGYITQSLALVDIDPAKVSFLGSATVLWCPLLEWLVDRKPMSLRQAPQTWLAAAVCLAGVGVLELCDVTTTTGSSLDWSSVSGGDVLALLQAVGFGTGVFWTSKMVNQHPGQALPVTATLIATTAFASMLWCLADGWMFTEQDWQRLAIPGMFLDPSLRDVAGAVLWTGLVSTSLNFFVELTALGRVPPSEASVILASEPLWAALFAAAFYGSKLTSADGIGGALIVAACLINAAVDPSWFGIRQEKE